MSPRSQSECATKLRYTLKDEDLERLNLFSNIFSFCEKKLTYPTGLEPVTHNLEGCCSIH